MEPDGQGVLGRWDATDEAIRLAMARGINRALREHKRIGNPVVAWDRAHDRVVIVPADEIEVPDDEVPEAVSESGPSVRDEAPGPPQSDRSDDVRS